MNDVAADTDLIFWEVAQLPPGAARDSFLSRACGDDSVLRCHLEKLLRAQPMVDRFLEEPFAGPAPEQPDPHEAPGTVIGPYKLLEQIGEGGMGLVFVAEQSHPIRRRVALKVLKPGLDTRHVLARFEAERQALALMDHPHIAQVFDAGIAPSGRPYFVMELVRGVPVTEFCDQRRLDPRQRLELFVSICQAVQHAHQKGIIHRDLKPSNILVTLHGTKAVPKVIDFGIAKATGERLTERTLFTNFAHMIGTPMYMSPEQAEMSGLDVDTRSDVYALGVLLYELLTGTTPFGRERLRAAGCDELRRILREEEPSRPSRQMSTLSAVAIGTISEQRGVDARQFRQLLRGDLDWIVMKALEKDRDRRYESASAFAQDVERYLANEAVQARPPSAVYRLRKFGWRNRTAVVAASIVAAALVAATAVSAWQAMDATAARRLADERADNEKLARQEAAREAAVASAVKDFLQMDLLRLADRQVQAEYGFVANPNLTVRQALNRAAAAIGQRFHDQPLVEADIQATIGRAYMGVGEDRLGVAHLERSLALYEANRPPHHPEVLCAVDRLGSAYKWLIQLPEAAAMRERAVRVATATFGPDHPDTLECTYKLGILYADAGQYSRGLPLLEMILSKRRGTLGFENPLTERTAEGLAHAYRQAGHWDKSIALVEPLLEKARITLGPNHEKTVHRMDLAARAYEHVGRLDEALSLHEMVLENYRQLFGPEDGQTLMSLLALSKACWAAGKLDRANGLLNEAVRIARTYDGVRGAINLAHAQLLLSQTMLMQQRFVEAERQAREALVIFEKHQPDFWWRFSAMSLVGGALMGEREYAAAEPFLVSGYEGLKQREATIYRPQIGRLTEAGDRLAQWYDANNQPAKSRALRDEISRVR